MRSSTSSFSSSPFSSHLFPPCRLPIFFLPSPTPSIPLRFIRPGALKSAPGASWGVVLLEVVLDVVLLDVVLVVVVLIPHWKPSGNAQTEGYPC